MSSPCTWSKIRGPSHGLREALSNLSALPSAQDRTPSLRAAPTSAPSREHATCAAPSAWTWFPSLVTATSSGRPSLSTTQCRPCPCPSGISALACFFCSSHQSLFVSIPAHSPCPVFLKVSSRRTGARPVLLIILIPAPSTVPALYALNQSINRPKTQ